jgi:hypothetical protein
MNVKLPLETSATVLAVSIAFLVATDMTGHPGYAPSIKTRGQMFVLMPAAL